MHDPNTVAFTIRFPWYHTCKLGSSTYRYWEPFITIWHVDPEKRGSDDSCGWFTPPFSKTTKEIINSLAGDEARRPWFAALEAKENSDPVSCERLVFGACMLMSRCLKNRGVIWREVSIEEAQRWAAEMTHNSIDNFRSSLCFLSGYHSNWYREGTPNTEKEDEWFREENARGFFGAIAGIILRNRRPWFKKPRWHFWHWKLQVHPLQEFKRWAFSRCCVCGKRFKWGYAPLSHGWHGSGPLWFRSESKVLHMECDEIKMPPKHGIVGSGASK